MSLVNDALKRAGKLQPKNAPPASGPPLRVAESTSHSRSQDILFSLVVLLILCLGGVLLWQWSHGENELQVRARSFPTASAATSKSQASHSPATPAVPIKMIPILPAGTDAVAPEVASEPPKPQPPAFKLQSVLYLPGNPSAVINGKVVHVNSSVNDARVTAIGPGTATIVTPDGRTKVLAMP